MLKESLNQLMWKRLLMKRKKELESKGYRIISLEENALLRIQEGKDAFISRNGNYTKEGVIYLPSKEIYLTKNSPIMKNAKEATECHRNNNEFCLNDKQVSNAIKKGISVKFPKNENYSIPTGRFGEDAITDFAFGNIAKDYGLFLKDAGIKEMPIWFASQKEKAFARQMWFRRRGSGSRSGLNGNDGNLYCDFSGARGVRDGIGRTQRCTSAEGAAQKMHSEKQISKALKEMGFSGLEKNLIETLKR